MKSVVTHLLQVAAVAIGFGGLALHANATLIDLGERDLTTRLNGINDAINYIETSEGLPPGTLTYFNGFDSDVGWKNDGALDSSFFTASLIDNDVDGQISWDLSTSGFQLAYVFLKDGRDHPVTGPFLYHLYGVTPDEVFNSMGDQFVTINGIRKINYIAFFGVPGSPAVPEGGTTLALLGLGLGAIELARRVCLRRARVG